MFAAAAAVATTAAGRLAAQDASSPVAAGSATPNNKLSVAVIGVNGRGGDHLNGFLGLSNCEVTHICDPDSKVGNNRVEQVGQRQGRAPKWEADIRKLLEDPSIDIVSVATPNHWHSLAAIWAIQAGKHVYVEKPVSHNVSEGRRVVEAARKYNKICQTGTQSRSNPGMRQAIEFVQQGGIGTVNLARGLCYKRRGSIGPRGEYTPPANVNYDLWLGPAPMAPLTRQNFHYDWHWQWPYGNGDLGNQGIHQMDIARWGLGLNRLSNSVLSYGGRFGYIDAGDTANTQVVIFDYAPKTLVFEVRGLETKDFKGASVGVIFEGTDGYVVLPSYGGGAAFDKQGQMTKEFRGDSNHYENFVQAVVAGDRKLLNADIEEGHLSSALCHLGNISYRLGQACPTGEMIERLKAIPSTDDAKATLERTVEHLTENKVSTDETPFQLGQHLVLDPEHESFRDHAQANQMLTRDYRPPFIVPPAGQV